MRTVVLSFCVVVFAFAVLGQTRDEALQKFDGLKKQAEVLEKTILSPDKKDIEAAALNGQFMVVALARHQAENLKALLFSLLKIFHGRKQNV